MAVRSFQVNITDMGASPQVIRDAGFTGEHNATELVFTLPLAYIAEGNRYYVDCIAGTGGGGRKYIELNEQNKLVFKVPFDITKLGATDISVNIVRLDEINEEAEYLIKSVGIKLIFKHSTQISKELADNYQTMLETIYSNFEEITDNFQMRIDNGDFVFAVVQTDEPTNDSVVLWVDPDDDGVVLDLKDFGLYTNMSGILKGTGEAVIPATADIDYVTPNNLDTLLEALETSIIEREHPIGSPFISFVDIDPATLYGGTWERIGNGRTLIGVDETDTDFNTAGKTGGEKTHTLTVDEMPNHEHKGLYNSYNGKMYNPVSSGTNYAINATTDAGADIPEINTGSAGGGQAHNNLPPYITCYIWIRTA